MTTSSTPPTTPTAAALAAAADDPRRLPIELVLPIEGMTCASCVNRIERFLKKTPGVEEASVNLATERATIRLDPAMAGRDEAVAAVRAAGYDVRAAAAPQIGASTTASALADEGSAEDLEREQAQRRTLFQAGASIAAAFVFMVLMFTPQTTVAMEDLNKLKIGRAS